MPKSMTASKQSLLFVINPISGDRNKDSLIDELKIQSGENGFSYEIFRTTGNNDTEKLQEILSKKHFDKVVAVGGDGTCNLVARQLINSSIAMGIIPLGSANGLASELTLPTNLYEAFQTVINGHKKSIDVLKINQDHLSLHLSDIGLNAKVVERFGKDNVRGFWGYAKHFFSELKTAKPVKFKLISEDKIIYRKAHMAVIANASSYGTGAIINPQGKIDDGMFEVIFVRPYSFWHLAKMIIPFYTRKIHTLDYVNTISCTEAVIQTPKMQVIQVDGEVIGRMDKISIECLPSCLQVLVQAM
ncbi:MAG TPA: YegS/Rv2252/BmrU family lipid kinase [Sunxiuqinia sp.]|nr:YegS/Rv2252/BmrU family lipid kinase [Sunxiuqinia sp.]